MMWEETRRGFVGLGLRRKGATGRRLAAGDARSDLTGRFYAGEGRRNQRSSLSEGGPVCVKRRVLEVTDVASLECGRC